MLATVLLLALFLFINHSNHRLSAYFSKKTEGVHKMFLGSLFSILVKIILCPGEKARVC